MLRRAMQPRRTHPQVAADRRKCWDSARTHFAEGTGCAEGLGQMRGFASFALAAIVADIAEQRLGRSCEITKIIKIRKHRIRKDQTLPLLRRLLLLRSILRRLEAVGRLSVEQTQATELHVHWTVGRSTRHDDSFLLRTTPAGAFWREARGSTGTLLLRLLSIGGRTRCGSRRALSGSRGRHFDWACSVDIIGRKVSLDLGGRLLLRCRFVLIGCDDNISPALARGQWLRRRSGRYS